MCVAAQPERSNMLAGIFCTQNDMGSPKACTSSPFTAFRWPAADNPYGPAPRIATSHRVMFFSPMEQDQSCYKDRIKECKNEKGRLDGARLWQVDEAVRRAVVERVRALLDRVSSSSSQRRSG